MNDPHRKPDYLAMSAAGHLVTMPGNEPLPAGFRLATDEDVAAVKARNAPLAPPAEPDEPELEHEPEHGDDNDEA